jgi:hypothetical protein
MTKRAYTKSGRLADVLALIQVLALDADTHRSESGINKEIQGKPASTKEWVSVAKEHPEFFRVDAKREHGLSLVARHVLPHEEDKPRPPLSSDFTAVLLQTAINLHDRQVQATDWWKSLIPLGAAVIGSAATLLTQFIERHFFQ